MARKTTKSKAKDKIKGRETNKPANPASGSKPVWIFSEIDRSGKFAFDIQRVGNDSITILDKIINYSTMTWQTIKQQTHDNGKSKHHYLNYSGLSEEARQRLVAKKLEDRVDDLFSFALENKLRIVGYTEQEKFYVLWYDPQHEVYPVK